MNKIKTEELTVKWIIPFILLTIAFGCNSTDIRKLAIETMDNASVSINIAEKVGARDVAATEMKSAEDMLTNAETSLQAGNDERAYRLGLRSYLHARIATEKALAERQESQVLEAQAGLELQQQASEEVFNNLEKLKTERDAQKK